jgi:hypothetical protein
MGEKVRVEFAGAGRPLRKVRPGEFPRPLSLREAETLRFMLSPNDPRLDSLREQAEVALVSGMCHCGCATVDLAVDKDRARPAAGLCSEVIDTRTPQFDPDKGPFELILYLADGWLKELEVVYYANDPPLEFPSMDRFEPPQLIC